MKTASDNDGCGLLIIVGLLVLILTSLPSKSIQREVIEELQNIKAELRQLRGTK